MLFENPVPVNMHLRITTQPIMLCKLPVFLLNPSGNPTQEADALLIHANSVVIINSRHPLENMEKSRSSDRFKK